MKKTHLLQDFGAIWGFQIVSGRRRVPSLGSARYGCLQDWRTNKHTVTSIGIILYCRSYYLNSDQYRDCSLASKSGYMAIIINLAFLLAIAIGVHFSLHA